MKYLTRLRLINWHYFRDQIIVFKGSTLLTGDSGSGKSTILDAIQYVLVGDARLVKFNSAAHDRSDRTLRTYLRCKVGENEDSNEGNYLRDGDFTSYVVLEFWDSRTSQSFLIGVGIDSYSTGEQGDPCFFKIEAASLDDLNLVEDRIVLNVNEFRRRVRSSPNATLYATIERYQRDLLHKLGFLSNHFFRVLVKAIGFRPISDMRKFVYNYLLDEDPVNVQVMRENLQQYNQFLVILNQTKEKISRLERIEECYREKELWIRRILVQDYIIRKAHLESHRERLTAIEREILSLEAAAAAAARSKTELESVKERAQQRLEDLAKELYSNAALQAVEKLERQLEATRAQVVSQQQAREVLMRAVHEESVLLPQVIAGLSKIQFEDADAAIVQHAAKTLQAAAEDLKALSSEWPERALNKDMLDSLSQAILECRQAVEYARRVREQRLRQVASEGAELLRQLDALSRNQRTYPPAVTRLRDLIASRVTAGGKPVQPRVLCELLEIPDPKWQDAVEGYLNTQRFDLIVPVGAFDQSLAIYERTRREHGIHGVGLVDGERLLREAPRREPNSLAEEVRTSDPIALAYINRLLGNVIKCRNEQELKRYRVSITPTCMTYRNGVARRINPEVYETPFIGSRAIAKQIEQARTRIFKLNEEEARLRSELQAAETSLKGLSDRQHHYARLLELQDIALRLAETMKQEHELEAQIVAVDLTEAERLKVEMSLLRQEINRLDGEIQAAAGAEVQAKTQIAERTRLKDQITADVQNATLALKLYAEQNPGVVEEASKRYEDEARSKTPQQIAANFEANRAGNETRVNNLKEELFKLRAEYNREFQFGGDEVAADNTAYSTELTKLRESELPRYEELIKRTRDAAEQEFKDHFVSKLKEKIDKAREQFAQLNRKLRDIEFGQERYQFEIRPRSDLKRYYDMITDDLLLEGGQSLFSELFQSKHGQAIADFFDRLLNTDEANQQKEIERLVDYRSYLDFDIKVISKDEVTRFSSVATQRSGGESQTPYYVAIVASFLQLYRGSNREDSIQLMMFDEAFDKMDGDRIEKTLTFIRALNLQLIAAAPPERIEWIAPFMDNTVLIIREGHRVWVEDYQQIIDGDPSTSTLVGSGDR